MLRQLLILMLPLVFVAFVGCGGKDDDEAPPTALTGPEHPDDMASRIDLQNKMKQAKQACSEGFGGGMLAAAPFLFAGGSPQGAMEPGSPLLLALAASGGQQEQCTNALNMALFNITKMQGGKYWGRADVQKWFYGNLAAIGDRVAMRLPPEALANPEFLAKMKATGALMIQNQVLPRLTDPRVRYQATQELSRYSTY